LTGTDIFDRWTGSQIVNKLNGLGINRLTMESDLKPALAQVISAINQIRKEKSGQSDFDDDDVMEIGYEEDDTAATGEKKRKPRKRCLSTKNSILLEGMFRADYV
jgi:hypothetical protein